MLKALIADNIAVHGTRFAAQHARKRGVCFSHFYMLAFGRAPRSRVMPPISYTEFKQMVWGKATALNVAQYEVTTSLGGAVMLPGDYLF